VTVVVGLVVGIAVILAVVIEFVDWLGRLDYLRANYPRVAAVVEKRAVRVVLLFVFTVLAARDLYDREVIVATQRHVEALRAGLIPFAEEGQKMFPQCLTLPQATIDDWANRVVSFLKSKGDSARVVRFTDESGIRTRLPDAAMQGYTAEQAFKCSHLDARLVRLNEFLKGD
jgi:hypothetical protein